MEPEQYADTIQGLKRARRSPRPYAFYFLAEAEDGAPLLLVGKKLPEIKKAGKEFVGKVFSPTGTKDFSSYISKIRNSGAEAVWSDTMGQQIEAGVEKAVEGG